MRRDPKTLKLKPSVYSSGVLGLRRMKRANQLYILYYELKQMAALPIANR